MWFRLLRGENHRVLIGLIHSGKSIRDRWAEIIKQDFSSSFYSQKLLLFSVMTRVHQVKFEETPRRTEAGVSSSHSSSLLHESAVMFISLSHWCFCNKQLRLSHFSEILSFVFFSSLKRQFWPVIKHHLISKKEAPPVTWSPALFLFNQHKSSLQL